MPMLTRAEAARALGVSNEAVYAAIKSGRLSARECVDGKIKVDSETMREEWARNTRPRIDMGPRAAGKGKDPQQLRGREERVAAPRITKTNEAIPDYDESRARTEHLKAELLELERKQKEGLLVPAADVEAKWVEIIVMARTKIMGIPTKAKQRIPDLDVDAIGVLDDIVRETLEDLANEAEEDDE
jgi:phage terminase Nu1 subunit (DNA packaging protein)